MINECIFCCVKNVVLYFNRIKCLIIDSSLNCNVLSSNENKHLWYLWNKNRNRKLLSKTRSRFVLRALGHWGVGGGLQPQGVYGDTAG